MKSVIAAMSVLLLSISASAQAADLEAAETLANEQCAACHGPTGVSQNPEWPIIAGQHADYLARTLRQYRRGERQDPLMQGIAAELSDEDIRNLAAWYARQDGLKTKKH